MSTNRINMIDSIIFDWDTTGKEYENKFELLHLYTSINGNTSITRSYVTKEGVKLGGWVSIQRSTKNQSLRIKLICQTLFYSIGIQL